MKLRKKRLVLEQVDRKLEPWLPLANMPAPPKGWIHTIRTSLGMSLRQLAERLNKRPQTVQDYERNEESGALTLQTLKEIAQVLDMRLVYALVPKEGNLQELVDRKAEEKAMEIVNRTHTTMALEDQANTPGRLMNAYTEKKNELKTEMPKFLWD